MHDREMRLVDLTVLAVWLAFGAYWLISAAGVKSATPHSLQFSATAMRVVIVVVAVLLVRSNAFNETSALVSDPAIQGIGLALFFPGLSIAVWARINLGRNWGTPMSEKVDAELITTGPYRFIRHPIYSGLILAVSGTALTFNYYVLIAAVAMAGYFIYSATVEERTMLRLFPDTYPAYKRSTKMLIPGLL